MFFKDVLAPEVDKICKPSSELDDILESILE